MRGAVIFAPRKVCCARLIALTMMTSGRTPARRPASVLAWRNPSGDRSQSQVSFWRPIWWLLWACRTTQMVFFAVDEGRMANEWPVFMAFVGVPFTCGHNGHISGFFKSRIHASPVPAGAGQLRMTNDEF